MTGAKSGHSGEWFRGLQWVERARHAVPLLWNWADASWFAREEELLTCFLG